MATPKQKSKKRRGTLTSPPKLTAGEALKKFANSPPTRFLATGEVGRAWHAAYERAGCPHGILSPEEGYHLALHYQDALRDEMRRICAQFPDDELFFAARMWSPGVMIEHGLSFGESEAISLAPSGDTLATMAVRRVVVAATLLYGGPVPDHRVTVVGGKVPPDQLGRFVACFIALMNLSYTYLFHARSLRFHSALGHGVDVRNEEMHLLGGDDEDVLTFSVDNRRHSYHNFLSRIGEFGEVPAAVLEPYEERGKRELAGGAALYSAWYEPDSRGAPGYRMRAQPLSYVEDVLLEIGRLHPDAAREA